MQSFASMLHQDRLLPADPGVRRIARALYEGTKALPIVSPHGHCDPAALADDAPFGSPATELVTKDHYILRMLYSQGVALEALGVRPLDGGAGGHGRQADLAGAGGAHSRSSGAPPRSSGSITRSKRSSAWKNHSTPKNADAVYDEISARLSQEDFRPRALFDRFGIEFLATTDGALDPLASHAQLRRSGWAGRVVPTFRPDDVIDPDRSGFHAHVAALGELTGADTSRWDGYLEALRSRRAAFIAAGATASDHGHPSPATADLSPGDAADLFARDHRREGTVGRRRAVPRPHAGRDGGHEHGRRARPADPRRCLAGPQSGGRRPFRPRPRRRHPKDEPTTWAASSRSSTGSATSPG